MFFKETQQFRQWWIWVLLIGLFMIPAIGFIRQVLMHMPFGDKPMSDLGLTIFLLIMVGILALFYFIGMTTEIDKNEIRLKFTPFFSRRFEWKDIENARMVNYGFVGGWGIRYSSKYGTVFNVSGNTGLAIITKSGKKYVIGTTRAKEMESVLKNKLD